MRRGCKFVPPPGDPRKAEVAAAIDRSLQLLVPPEGVLARTLIEAWLAGRVNGRAHRAVGLYYL